MLPKYIYSHLINNDISNFQYAYKTGHSCETVLLRLYNDIVTTIGRGNGAMLELLDLPAAFDTIDHDNLFCILEKYVGICGNALKLMKSYFSNRTQRVQVDNVLSDFANIICGVPQGSVLGPLKWCLYLLPLSAILRFRNIGYHVCADDTQLYVSFHSCLSPHFHIRNIGKIRNLLSYDACSTIIHALISCRLDYCNNISYRYTTDLSITFHIGTRLTHPEHFI